MDTQTRPESYRRSLEHAGSSCVGIGLPVGVIGAQRLPVGGDDPRNDRRDGRGGRGRGGRHGRGEERGAEGRQYRVVPQAQGQRQVVHPRGRHHDPRLEVDGRRDEGRLLALAPQGPVPTRVRRRARGRPGGRPGGSPGRLASPGASPWGQLGRGPFRHGGVAGGEAS